MTDQELRFAHRLCGVCFDDLTKCTLSNDICPYKDKSCWDCEHYEERHRTFDNCCDLELLMAKVVRGKMWEFSLWLATLIGVKSFPAIDTIQYWFLKTPAECIALILEWAKIEFKELWKEVQGEN